ncbi:MULTISPECIES: M28 family metallopeptidase [Brevundimonas]|uniref:M28 family metallopeptidase n=1 Tax=Brevundimonas sp. 357 TaxID=2555782 RepID=UPI000F784D30|nr:MULTISPECIES: M28 family metallopeptidase [Brevundimonas]RSB47515.1 M28 family peptidase [Brevundimonas sp. 357]
MRISSSVAVLAFAAALAGGAAAQAQTQAQTAPAFDAARISQDIRVLSDDSFEGRGIATPAEQKVIDYLSRQYAAAGFAPGGENGGWTQAVGLNRFTVSNISGRLKLGDWSQPLTQGQEVTMTTRLPGAAVDLKDKPLVFVGYGVNAPERQWNDFKTDVRGKVIVVLVNDADFEDPSLNTFGGEAMTYYGRWTYKYEEAARQGAAGVLIVHETKPASYGWTTVANSWGVPQFDIVRANPTAERVPMEAWIQRDLAVDLFRRAGLDFEQEKIKARSRDFQPVELTGATIDASFDVKTDRIVTHNIVAKLEGASHPDETILYTGHWDHIGMGEPDANGDRIFNGAIDNASGTAGLLELARAYAAGPRPERTIVMIGFTAEESGLLGSEFYAANPLYPLEKTVGGFNLDSAAVFGRMNKLGVTGYGHSELDEPVIAAAAAQGRGFVGDAGAAAGIYFRSDHFPLAKKGVPMAYLSSTGDFIDAPIEPRQAKAADYRANRYHQAADEWEADWDYGGMLQDLEVIFKVGQDLANSRDWPEWKPGSEFGGERAKSADQRR